jgi:hypothetical protein
VKHSKSTVIDPRTARDEKVALLASALAIEMSGGNKQRARETLSAVRLMRNLRRDQEDTLAKIAVNNERAYRNAAGS